MLVSTWTSQSKWVPKQYRSQRKLCFQREKGPRSILLRPRSTPLMPVGPESASVPLRGLRTSATVWNLLFYRHLCPASITKCRAKKICKGQQSWGIREQERSQHRTWRVRGWVAWVWTQVLFHPVLLEPPSCPRECSSAFYPCVGFKLDSKVEHSYPVRVRGQKSQREPLLHTNVGGPLTVLPSFPVVITYVG